MSTSKTGKHGHAKCKFMAVDIFTSQKMDKVETSTHNVDIPNVVRQEYLMIDLDDDGEYPTLMHDNGDQKEDISMTKNKNFADVASKIDEMWKTYGDSREIFVTVLTAMGESAIVDCKLGSGE